MIRAVLWRPDALVAIPQLKREIRDESRRIGWAIDRFTTSGLGDVKKLTGQRGEFRLRVGDWRVRFTIDAESQAMVILQVVRRNEATYRG